MESQSSGLKPSTLRLPRLFSDGMVLQRDVPIKIWGWAPSGELVAVRFQGKTYSAVTGADGKWQVILPALQAGGPHDMIIEAGERIVIQNILIGDVWVCSGQSNMVLPMARVQDRYPAEIAAAANPALRLFIVPDRWDFNEPQDDLEAGFWETVNPVSILRFTATGYFFAKSLYQKYHIPIGLINASVGGSPVTAWMSEDALRNFPAHLETARKFGDPTYRRQITHSDQVRMDAWQQRLDLTDRGLIPGEKPWFDPDYDTAKWPMMELPGFWKDTELGPVNGVVWFRREIALPAAVAGLPARLLLGRIVDSDTAYVNGVAVGATGYQYPPRKYDIPAGLLHAGRNVIVVRVVNTIGAGGFITDKPYRLTVGGQTIDLQGEWQCQVGAVAEPLPGPAFLQYQPLGLFNGMIAPLLDYSLKGVIWYQGESDTDHPLEYRKLFTALIADWRDQWGQGDFPFLYVQLANYLAAKGAPSDSNWALLRDAQLKMLAVPNTAMAVAIDLGEWNDLHPLNKEDVGKRLALAAQKTAYADRSVVSSGPLYHSYQINGEKIAITFTNVGSGLICKDGGELRHFAIAGADGNFVWADAKIEDDRVIVWSEQVAAPVNVRYAWADNPAGANLYNKEGLPASPFRTDELLLC